MRPLLAALMLTAAVAQAAPLRVAILPLREPSLGAAEVGEIEHALVEAVAALPNASVANLSAAGRLTSPRGLEPQPAARAQALGRELGASRAMVIDVARLGDGAVVYLSTIDPRSGQSLASTTASIGALHPLSPDDRRALRGAVVRVLDPARYVGYVSLKLDVKGAEVQVDGRPMIQDPGSPIALPVGTHALRVTHPAYHDFLRFIDVRFGETVSLEVPLAAYPLAEGEMAERLQKKTGPAGKPLPWYRRWWALTAGSVVLTGVTVGIVFAARPELTADRTLTYRAAPTP